MIYFIKLTNNDGRTIFINVDHITNFYEYKTDASNSSLYLSNSTFFISVKETTEEILQLLNNHN